MKNYSPLRYPGGKAKLSPFINYIIQNKLEGITTYIEPFAGGAGVALDLLLNESVERIIINDYDKAIYSFWRALLTETNRFIDTIRNVEITIDEWHKQKNIYINNKSKYSFELGFATFFLNRTNRSGIISAGPIGGYDQTGNYSINVRFNKEGLIERIERIAEKKKNIKLYNKDIRSFIQQIISANQENAFVYFDPPYYIKGQELYQNYLNDIDHREIHDSMVQYVHCPWVMTYDNVENISSMYADFYVKQYDLTYSLANKGKASELIIFSNEEIIPNTDKTKIKIY